MAMKDDGPIPLAGDSDAEYDDSAEAREAETGGRAHHVFFAHHIFRELTFEDPLPLFAVAATGKGADFVKDVWRKVGEQLLESGASTNALPDNDLTVEATNIAGHPAVLIHLPPPKGPPEAYFVAVVLTEQPRRRWLFWRTPPRISFVTLEHGVSIFAEDDPHTVLGEWKQDGTHVNYGRGPIPSKAAFVEAVLNLVSRPWKMVESSLGLGAQRDDPADTRKGPGISEDLMRAAGAERLDELERLIANGADIRATDEQRRMTLLHFAAAHGQTDVIKFLIAKGADVDAADTQGFTPLHIAAGKAPATAIEILIANGADIHAKTNDGVTALHAAVLDNRTEVAKLLIAQGADLNERGEHGGSALHYAVSQGHGAVVELLLAEGANAHVKDDEGRTALHIASHLGHKGLVKLLIGNGAEINAKDCHGRTALQAAEAQGHHVLANMLRSHDLSLFDVLMDALCCIMVSDQRVSRSERKRIHELMIQVKCPWDSSAIDRRIEGFIAQVKDGKYRSLLETTCESVKAFKTRGKAKTLLTCLEALAKADGKIEEAERRVYERFKKALE